MASCADCVVPESLRDRYLDARGVRVELAQRAQHARHDVRLELIGVRREHQLHPQAAPFVADRGCGSFRIQAGPETVEALPLYVSRMR